MDRKTWQASVRGVVHDSDMTERLNNNNNTLAVFSKLVFSVCF